MRSKKLFYGIAFVVFSACAKYELQPLGMNHPANPLAMAAPALPLSDTLAYRSTDMTALSTTPAPKGEHEGHHPGAESNDKKTVDGEGKIIATVPNANQVVVEHGAIPGFMDAMTMGYRVEPTSLLKELKPGDQVRFTIDVQNKTIVKIEKLK